MPFTRGKIVIIAVAAGIVGGLAGLIQFSSLESQVIAPQMGVHLQDVRMKQIDEEKNVMMVVVDFNIENQSDKTLTISKLEYELFADEISVGRGFISLEDIPLGGRPQLFSGSGTTIPSEFRLKYSDDVSNIWDMLASGEAGQVAWRAKGSAEIESAFSIIPIEFESSL